LARHRSPRGRRPNQTLLAAPSRPAEVDGRRGDPVPILRRTLAATAAAASGALLVGTQAGAAQTLDDRLLNLDSAATGSRPERTGLLLSTGDLRPSIEPVVPEVGAADASALVKAAGLADLLAAEAAAAQQEAAMREAAAQEAAAARAAQRSCPPNRAGFGPVKPWVAEAGLLLRCQFGIRTVGGVAPRSTPSDHPRGLALDFMADRATGDALAECALSNMDALSIKYIIWRQRINTGSGWKQMEDRGSATANHMGHVHISFDEQPVAAAEVAC
jgi:hypothetical protein